MLSINTKTQTTKHPGIFQGLWPLPNSKISKKSIIPNFLVPLFGENFMKISTKIPKLQMHEILHENMNGNCFHSHFYANFMRFYDGQFKQQICYSFTLLIPYTFLIHLKWWPGSFRLHQVFPIFPNAFPPKFNRPLAPTSER